MFITDLRTHLVSKSNIEKVVKDRIFPNYLPQDEIKPAIVYSDTGSTRNISYQNQGTKIYRIQFNVIDVEYKRAKELAQSIIEIFHCCSGLLGANQILLGRLVNEKDLFENKLHEIAIEFEFEVV